MMGHCTGDDLQTWFSGPEREAPSMCSEKKEKQVTNMFSFSHNAFCPFKHKSNDFSHIFVTYKYFHFCYIFFFYQ